MNKKNSVDCASIVISVILGCHLLAALQTA